MTNRSARTLRRVLELPRVPKTMTGPQRAYYRTLKRRYAKLPAPMKARFLDNVTALRAGLVSNPSTP